MGTLDFEDLLGRHCAPTFRGLKAASLVAFPQMDRAELTRRLKKYQGDLEKSGIVTLRLLEAEDRVLVLFYRPEALRQRLEEPAARRILAAYGYPPTAEPALLLAYLRCRLRGAGTFPHEIGLFLGYPPQDVAGFIRHRGRNFVCCGFWKVYDNAPAAQACFALYQACTMAFCRQLRQGVPLTDLLQAV